MSDQSPTDPAEPAALAPADRALLLGLAIQQLQAEPDAVLVMFFAHCDASMAALLPPHICARIAATYADYKATAERIGKAHPSTLESYQRSIEHWAAKALRAA